MTHAKKEIPGMPQSSNARLTALERRMRELIDLNLSLKARVDALEGRREEATDRAYMKACIRGDKTEQRALLMELDRKGGMPHRSSVCLTGEKSRTAAARG